MGTTITVRTERALRLLLEERAASTGKSLSEVVREILDRALCARVMGDRIRHLRGSLDRRTRRDDGWSRSIRARNWRS